MAAADFTILSAILAAVLFLGMFSWFVLRRAPERRGVVVLSWAGAALIMAATALLGNSGVLSDFSTMPPRFFGLVLFVFLVPILLMRSAWGRLAVAAIPVWALIAFQSFRVLPELLLHLSYTEGLAPQQMTFHGLNFDILTAVAAPFFALLATRPGWQKRAGWAFSAVGIGLLVNILTIAMLSTPVFDAFDTTPANTFVATFPFIWLPAVHVLLAVLAHLLLVAKLLAQEQPANHPQLEPNGSPAG